MEDMEAFMSPVPVDRLTALADLMVKVLDDEDDVQAMVFLNDGKLGGIVMHGYEHPQEAIVDLLVHLKAMFQAGGADLDFVAVPDFPEEGM